MFRTRNNKRTATPKVVCAYVVEITRFSCTPRILWYSPFIPPLSRLEKRITSSLLETAIQVAFTLVSAEKLNFHKTSHYRISMMNKHGM